MLRRIAILTVAAGAIAAAIAVSIPAASAATKLPAPGTPVASQITQTSDTFSWAPSSGPVLNYTVQVIDVVGGLYHDVVTTTATSYTHTGLTPDHPYAYHVIANPKANSGYVASDPSGVLYVQTLPLPDTIPPTAPGTPTVYNISTIAATLNYTAATDNNRVANYVGQILVNGVWTDNSSNNNTTLYLHNLSPATTYTAAVLAVDANGNRGPRSGSVTFTTRALQPLPTCSVQILALGSSYQLNATIENMTASTVLSNWSITFTMAAAQTVNYSFNSTITHTGNTATAVGASYNATVDPGGTTSFGASINQPAGTAVASNFNLTGVGPCTIH
jgi:hypothetical protein